MRAVLLLAACLASGPALAAECPQQRAIYADRAAAYEFAFEPVGSDAAATSHHFKLRVLKSNIVLDGIVMTGDDVVRSNGMIMHNCPEGDATGEEIAACTVWEGVLYAVDGSGAIDLLPAEDADAAERILVPGLGPSIRYSAVWEAGQADVAPWDVLTFKGCGS
jgi:hypothetical protein